MIRVQNPMKLHFEELHLMKTKFHPSLGGLLVLQQYDFGLATTQQQTMTLQSSCRFYTMITMTTNGRSLSCPCDSCWNLVIPVESSGIWQKYFLAEPPAKITIPGTIYLNWDQNGPGMESGGMHFACIINDQCTPHLGCFCPIGVSTGH